MARVAIIERRLPAYRVPLLERLRERLAAVGIELRVLHGPTPAAETDRADAGEMPGAELLPTRYFASGRVVLQPYAARVADCSLVIVSHENRLVHNHLALADARRPWSLAFFGHGRNLQSTRPQGWRERFKRATALRADWWFAYTRLSAQIVADAGFPAQRITVVDNAIDTTALREAVAAARLQPAAALRRGLGLPELGPMALALGSLHGDRRVDWLPAAAQALRRRHPGFHLAIAGDGPERARLQQLLRDGDAAAAVTWLGAVDGERKAQLLACADVMVNAGAIGLAVLDGFAAGLPLVATGHPHHGPEVAYLADGRNGLLRADSLDDFIAGVDTLLGDDPLRRRLASAAMEDGLRLGIEPMADRFVDGIRQCLAAGRRRTAR